MDKSKPMKNYYEKEAGDTIPSCQIAYHEWHIRYVKWLEEMVMYYLNN